MNFFILEDHKVIRELLINRLKQEYASSLFTESDNMASLQANTAQAEKADICILDLEMPDGNALDWLEKNSQSNTLTRTVILSSVDSDVVFLRATASGVAGFVHKNDGIDTLITAIKTVLTGGRMLSPTVQKMRSKINSNPNAYHKILSDAEQMILSYLANGFSNEEIAQITGRKENTIADHKTNVMRKLGLSGQAELVRYAIDKGFASKVK